MRFVIQNHTNNIDHYDLMIEIENNDKLFTWNIAISDMELLLSGKKISARRINNHRKDYLFYEGPVSGNRGVVKIFDSGESITIKRNEKDLEFKFTGRRLNGNIQIWKDIVDEFNVKYIIAGR